eukprot:1514340-Pyramimonas_sp.AAC.1
MPPQEGSKSTSKRAERPTSLMLLMFKGVPPTPPRSPQDGRGESNLLTCRPSAPKKAPRRPKRPP